LERALQVLDVSLRFGGVHVLIDVSFDHNQRRRFKNLKSSKRRKHWL
jgi:hypothetical protein